jgi:uncharacterized protein YkwD
MFSLYRTAAILQIAGLLLAPSAAADKDLRTSGKIPVKATAAKVNSKFEVQKDEWVELEVQGQWRMSDKQDYVGVLGHMRLNKINNLGSLGALIVQIGNAAPFALTEDVPFQAPATGVVQLWPNRQGFTSWKADGELTVIIRAGEALKAKKGEVSPEVRRTLATINQARKACGLEETKLSDKLSVGCQKHARYLIANAGNPLVAGLKVHEEHKELKEYSEEGAKSAPAAVIHSMPPSVAAKEWLASLYHRVPLLDPALQEVGVGYAQQNGDWACVVDTLNGTYGKKSKDMVFYPEDGQANVEQKFGNEIPVPMPAEHKGDAGFPITIQFTRGQKVTNVEMKLTGLKDAEVPIYLSTPEKPATSFPQQNTVCAIPRQPLARAMTYTAVLNCLVEGKPFTRTWRFTTEK